MTRAGRRPDAGGVGGSALLVVVGATAALAVVAQLLLLSATTAWATLSFQADRRQAAQLARGALHQVDAGLGAGSLEVPPPGPPVDVTGALSPVPAPPAAWGWRAPRDWPPVTAEPPAASSPVLGRGRRVLLRRVPGPDGVPRSVPVTTPGGDTVQAALLEARAVAWFRRATVEIAGRYLVRHPDAVRRLE